MVNFLTVACILAMWAVVVVSSGAQSAPSQPPSEAPGGPDADCSTLIYNMMDCMSFLGKGGDETTPDRSCCSGFKTVLKANADCICYALSSSASLGLDINMTRAEALPSDCGVSAPPISNCNVSTSPGASPANPPAASAPPSNSPSLPPTTQPPAPTAAPGGAAAAPSGTARAPASQATAPSPRKSGAYTISATFSAFLVIVVSFLLFNA